MFALVAFLALLTPYQQQSTPPGEAVFESMVLFDQFYIPSLLFTKRNDLPNSRRAIAALRREWNDLRRRTFSWASADPKGAADYGTIDGQILKAEETIAYGRSLSEAHEALEGIRTIVHELRRRLGMDYFPDRLTDFHAPMERLTLAVREKEPGGLSADEIGSMKTTLEMARGIWKQVAEADFDSKRYRFNTDKTGKLKKGIQEVEAALQSLSSALDAGDQAKIIQQARSLQPAFAKVYLLFGAFTG